MSSRFLWTVTLRGGSPFEMQIPGNPTLEHDGGTTAGHLYVSQEEISLIGETCEKQGVRFEFAPMNSAGSSQKAERKRLFQRPEEISVLCSACPTCPWYDPVTLGDGKTCFLREAPRESSMVLFQASEKFRQAAQDCPLTNS